MSISAFFPSDLPTNGYNFSKTRRLPPNTKLTRASIGTYVDSDGLIKTAQANEPRFDYDYSTGQVKGVLIEQQKTNFVWPSNTVVYNSGGGQGYSSEGSGCLTEVVSEIISPNGSSGVSKIFKSTGNTAGYVHVSRGNPTYGQILANQSLSVFLKAAPLSTISFLHTGLGTFTINLAAGTTSTGNLIPYPNGWFRFTFFSPVTGACRFYPGGTTYVGDGTSGVYMWGAQIENDQPTSLIYTTNAYVTRAADTLTIPLKDQDFSSAEFLYTQNNALNLTTPLATFSSSASSPSYSLQLSNPNGVPTLRQVVGSFPPAVVSLPKPATLQTTANVAINFNKTTGQTELISSVVDTSVAAVKQLPSTAGIPFTSSFFNLLTIGPCEGLKAIYLWPNTLTTNQLASLAQEQGAFNKSVVTTSGFQDELYDKIDTTFDKPALYLDFAGTKSLTDKINGTSPLTFTRPSTATYIDSDGLIKTAASNVPRYDHDPLTRQCIGLMIEESRTNSMLNSSSGNPELPSAGVSVVTNSEIAPDGTTTATRVTVSSTQDNTGLRWNGWSISTSTVRSFYVKVISGNGVTFHGQGGLGDPYTWNISTLSYSSDARHPTGGVIPIGNGWFRCWMGPNSTTEVNTGTATFLVPVSSGTYAFWGFQVESGRQPSSYIPTTSSSVTRSAETVSTSSISSWYTDSNSTFLQIGKFTSEPAQYANASGIFSIGNSSLTADNNWRMRIMLRFSSRDTQFAAKYLNNTGNAEFTVGTNPATTPFDYITAVGYSTTGHSGYTQTGNGSSTSYGANSPLANVTRMQLHSEAYRANHTVSKLIYWKSRFSDTILRSLASTTIFNSVSKWSMVLDSSLPSDGVCAIITSGTVTYTVDWGDETAIETVVATGTFTKTHAYSVPKEHVVKIAVTSGTFRPFYNNSVYVTYIRQLRPTPSGWSFGTSLSTAWYGGTRISFIDSALSTSGVTDFGNAWRNCTSIVNFPAINTSSGTNFTETWMGCTSLVNFSPINTTSATSLSNAWRDCTSLKYFPFINTSSCTNFSRAWYNCSSMTNFPLLNFSNASSGSFFQTWYFCSSMKEFPLINTVNSDNFGDAWRGCSSLTSFPLINTSNSTSFAGAWSGCSGLTSFPAINTQLATTLFEAWQNCSGLTSFPTINTANCTNFCRAWQNCSSLISFPFLNVSNSTGAAGSVSPRAGFLDCWSGCTSLVNFPANMFDTVITNEFSSAFLNCALSAQSIENILVSINTSTRINGILTLSGGTNAQKSTWTTAANTAYDSLIAKGWTISFRA